MIDHPALEHGGTRTSRWLRRYRTRIAFWIAVIEAILLVFGAISRWGAVVVAVLVIVGYFAFGVRLRSALARDIAWIAAVSQALVALVPVLVIVVGTVALIAVGILAIVALILLFGDRR
ncbi:MAG TPA: hypothetical protein VGU26_09110 [Gaiellaceae bacterium]|nr:hypothetical protein [Gaiellaceae bacterium]